MESDRMCSISFRDRASVTLPLPASMETILDIKRALQLQQIVSTPYPYQILSLAESNHSPLKNQVLLSTLLPPRPTQNENGNSAEEKASATAIINLKYEEDNEINNTNAPLITNNEMESNSILKTRVKKEFIVQISETEYWAHKWIEMKSIESMTIQDLKYSVALLKNVKNISEYAFFATAAAVDAQPQPLSLLLSDEYCIFKDVNQRIFTELTGHRSVLCLKTVDGKQWFSSLANDISNLALHANANTAETVVADTVVIDSSVTDTVTSVADSETAAETDDADSTANQILCAGNDIHQHEHNVKSNANEIQRFRTALVKNVLGDSQKFNQLMSKKQQEQIQAKAAAKQPQQQSEVAVAVVAVAAATAPTQTANENESSGQNSAQNAWNWNFDAKWKTDLSAGGFDFGLSKNQSNPPSTTTSNPKSDIVTPAATQRNIEDNGAAESTLEPIIDLPEVSTLSGHENERLLTRIPVKHVYVWGEDVSGNKCWKVRASKTTIAFYASDKVANATQNSKSNDNDDQSGGSGAVDDAQEITTTKAPNKLSKARMVCRESETEKLRLNQWISANMQLTKKSEVSYSWLSIDGTFADTNENNTIPNMFATKFNNEQDATSFKTAFESAQRLKK